MANAADNIGFDDLEDFDLPGDPAPKGGEPGGKGKDKAGDDGISIPKARFDQEVAKLRRQRDELEQQLRAKTTPPPEDQLPKLETELSEQEDAYEEALLDGDKEKARTIRNAMKELRRKIDAEKYSRTTGAASTVSREESAFQRTVADIEAKYPILDSNSDSFDEELTDDVLAMMQGMVQRGKSRSDALKAAVKRLVPEPGDASKDKRGLDSRRKAADANRRQPPSRPGLGGGLSADDLGLDVNTMTGEELAKLDPKKLSVLRGDVLD